MVDHIFICTAQGAPAAGRLLDFGLQEGTPNRHPGQGTANRRFFFRNAMLELLWVEDPAEAQTETARPLRLGDRWSAVEPGTSPFGIILRPTPGSEPVIPFHAWEYRPVTMPGLVLQIASGAGMTEPFWAFMPTGRRPDEWPPERRQPLNSREITAFRLSSPALDVSSVTRSMAAAGIISWQQSPQHSLELEFDGARHGHRLDFSPDLPLAFLW